MLGKVCWCVCSHERICISPQYLQTWFPYITLVSSFPPMFFFSQSLRTNRTIRESFPANHTVPWSLPPCWLPRKPLERRKWRYVWWCPAAQGRSERGVCDRPFTLPAPITRAFPLSHTHTHTRTHKHTLQSGN